MVGFEEVVGEVEKESKKHKRFFRFLEFFIIGFVFGVIEDMMVVVLATDANITGHTLLVAAFVALPFAVLSELIVDKPEVRNFLHKKYLQVLFGTKQHLRKKR